MTDQARRFTQVSAQSVGKGAVALVAMVAVLAAGVTARSGVAAADGVERVFTSEPGCFEVLRRSVGLAETGAGAIEFPAGPGPVAFASLVWTGINDTTPDDVVDPVTNRADSTLTVNGVEVEGEQVDGGGGTADTANGEVWYAWSARLGPEGTGQITEASTSLTISGWDAPEGLKSRRNGAILTVVYSTSPCLSATVVDEYEGVDYFYHGSNDAVSAAVFLPVQNTPVETTMELPFGLAGAQTENASCRGLAVWLLAGNGELPARGAFPLVDTSGAQGVGVNGGVEIANDPFPHAAGTCEPAINQAPPLATYAPGHPFPGGAAEAPYRATGLEHPDGDAAAGEIALAVINIVIPPNTDWIAFQIESEAEQGGESGAWVASQTFSRSVAGALGDYVWFDRNRNCRQDADEVGVEGVAVELFDASGELVQETTTNGAGNYLFQDLLPADYSIGFTPPEGYGITANDCDVDDLRDSNVDPATGSTGLFPAIENGSDLSIDAGLTRPADVELTKSVSATAEGSFGPTLEGALDGRAWFSIDVTTETVGADGLPLGDALGVSVRDMLPAGLMLVSSSASVGTFDPATGLWEIGDMVPGSSAQLLLQVDITSLGTFTNVAEVITSTPDIDSIPGNGDSAEDDMDDATITVPTMSVGDTVWVDANADACQAGDEVGLAGVTVQLFDADGGLVAEMATAADGSYLFEGLAPGDYTVVFGEVEGFVPTASESCPGELAGDSNPPSTAVSGGPGDTITDVDHGLIPLGSIGDTVWLDVNGDGCQAPSAATGGTTEPGVAGVTVELLRDGVVVSTTQTSETGQYLFDGLLPGNYTVRFDVGGATADGGVVAGGAASPAGAECPGGSAEDSDGPSVSVELPVGGDDSSIDMGIVPPPPPPAPAVVLPTVPPVPAQVTPPPPTLPVTGQGEWTLLLAGVLLLGGAVLLGPAWVMGRRDRRQLSSGLRRL